MHKRIAPGLAVVAAGLVVLASGSTPTAAQEKGKAPAKAAGPKHLYGHDLKVRPGGDKDWPKARKVGLEVYHHEVTIPVGEEKKVVAFHIGITEDGVVGVFPATPVGEKKDAQWLTGLDLLVRKAGEKEFTQRTQRYGVELFRDLGSNRLVYVCESGAVAFAPVPGTLSTEKGPKWHHGLAPKVREPERERFENAKQYGVEVYKDESTGGLVYACETGAISTGPAPAAPPDKNKVADPKHTHGLVLMVRKADEPDFVTGKTRRLGVEVFEDPNAANNLLYLTETGSVAVVPNPGKYRDAQGPPKWRGAMALAARKAGERDFGKAKRYGIEIFEDIKTGNLLFVSETGSIAVLVP
jgi:hypothetical protein